MAVVVVLRCRTCWARRSRGVPVAACSGMPVAVKRACLFCMLGGDRDDSGAVSSWLFCQGPGLLS
jgi:hypothetical protein